MKPPLDESAVALFDGRRAWTLGELDAQGRRLSDGLAREGVRVLGTLMDNGPAWVVADRAAALIGAVHVPLPGFFTAEQVAHATAAAGVDALLVPAAAAMQRQANATPCEVAGEPLVLVRMPARAVRMPEGTAKVTFTSGTTGQPKGVCLSTEAMDHVAEGLVQGLRPLGIRRHLCALPFAVLLENVAGLLAPLMNGATCVTLPLHDVGMTGSSSFDPARFHVAVLREEPHSVIVLPQMLRAWTAWLARSGAARPRSLRFVAVGGAAVGARLIEQARALGIPAYEGYGLSEGASVQTLNLPGQDRPGSAGRPLPHAGIRIAPGGQVEVKGSLFAGYLGDATPVPQWWPTGDLGRIDTDGFLHIEGRARNVLITGFGRNVSPEWVETALTDAGAIAHAAVFGEGEAALGAVLWPLHAGLDDAALQAAVDAANASLPDYARVAHWTRACDAFSAATGLATANGRPLRAAILQRHAARLGPASSDRAATPSIHLTPETR